ncbi:MAG: hypothetical protein OEZ02_15540, partial [Anaerolineae bacterium]|nr:hypothetical protein [Anaerolineae bacterium]
MEIISLEFMYFVLAALAVYYVLPGKLQNAFLLIASYYFYVLWSWKYAVVLVVLTIFNYTYAHLIKGDRKRKQVMLQIGVGVNLLVFGVMLFGYKLEPGLNQILSNLGKPGWVVHILVPLGFSYAVLECISYLVDVNRKLLPAHRNLVDFGLYLVYFPKMISGPIARAKTFLPMLQEAKSIDNQIVTRSIGLVLTGLLRSIVFAGMLAMLSPDVYSDPERYSNTQLALDMLAFGFILYNQFAGYTNIVRGVSGLF